LALRDADSSDATVMGPDSGRYRYGSYYRYGRGPRGPLPLSSKNPDQIVQIQLQQACANSYHFGQTQLAKQVKKVHGTGTGPLPVIALQSRCRLTAEDWASLVSKPSSNSPCTKRQIVKRETAVESMGSSPARPHTFESYIYSCCRRPSLYARPWMLSWMDHPATEQT
jgi:hypothetical protein